MELLGLALGALSDAWSFDTATDNIRVSRFWCRDGNIHWYISGFRGYCRIIVNAALHVWTRSCIRIALMIGLVAVVPTSLIPSRQY